MRARELRALTDEELRQHHRALLREYFELQIRFATEQVENPKQKRNLRKEIARVKTILRERALGLERVNAKG